MFQTKTPETYENDNIFHIVDQIKISMVLLYKDTAIFEWRSLVTKHTVPFILRLNELRYHNETTNYVPLT